MAANPEEQLARKAWTALWEGADFYRTAPIPAVKAVRKITGWDLKASKRFVDSVLPQLETPATALEPSEGEEVSLQEILEDLQRREGREGIMEELSNPAEDSTTSEGQTHGFISVPNSRRALELITEDLKRSNPDPKEQKERTIQAIDEAREAVSQLVDPKERKRARDRERQRRIRAEARNAARETAPPKLGVVEPTEETWADLAWTLLDRMNVGEARVLLHEEGWIFHVERG